MGGIKCHKHLWEGFNALNVNSHLMDVKPGRGQLRRSGSVPFGGQVLPPGGPALPAPQAPQPQLLALNQPPGNARDIVTAKQEHGALGKNQTAGFGDQSAAAFLRALFLSGGCYQLPGYWILSVLMMPYLEVPWTLW